MIEFSCPWGTFPTVITLSVLAFFLVMLFVLVKMMRVYWNTHRILSYLMLGGILIIFSFFITPGLYTPLRISVGPDQIVIHRIIGNKNIPMEKVKDASLYKSNSNSIRLFASGGLWGYIGKFKNKEMGTYTMYVTHPKQMVLLHTDEGYFVFSCEKHSEVLDLIKQYSAIY